MSAPDDATRIGNRYRLEQRIGAGAMGAVWLGTDELLNRAVAVKELLAALDTGATTNGDALEESRQRLMREGRIGARLQHPHVISMFDVVVHDERPWLVMEYLPSKSLAGMLAETGPMEPRVVAEIGRQVADGLAAAHTAGVVHRDVKPGNVLIADDGRVKLTDFGVSRAVDDVQLTRTGLIAGTPAFLSPEVARGQEPTAASDVFALGATLYAAVEGRPPFGLDDNAYALLHKVATAPPEPPRQAGALTALLMQLLSDDPADRPTAAQARDTLAALAEGRPTPVIAPTGTAVLDVAADGAAAKGGRTALAFRDARPSSGASELVATAAAVPPVATVPRTPSGPGGGDRGAAGGRRRAVLLTLLGVVVVVLGVLAVVLSRGGSTAPSVAAASSAAPAPAVAPATPGAASSAPQAPTTAAAPTASVAPPTEPPSASATVPAGALSPVAFIQNYYNLLPSGTDAAWAMLGPDAQSASGGRDGFDSFYGKLSRTWAENLRVNGSTVTATIVFTDKSGSVDREPYTFVVGSRDGRQVIESFNRGG